MKKFSSCLLGLVLLFSTAQLNGQSIPKWSLKDLKTALDTTQSPTIFNFWATFCKPCIEEIPHFQALAAKYKAQGLRLILVNLDSKAAYPVKLKSFVQKRKFTAPVVFLTETNADLFCPAVDESWSGAIPATLFINRKTGFRKFVEDPLKYEQVETTILQMLGQ
jgi:thiol-disulfide isomerase/thioredoxin